MSPARRSPQNILLIRLKSIGDVVFSLPAIQTVRANFPEGRLYFLVSREYVPIVSGFKEVDEIIPLDRKLFRSGNAVSAGRGVFQLLRDLRRPGFSHVIDLQGYGETEWLAWWTGASERWSYQYNPLRGMLYTRQGADNRRLHPAARHVDLLGQFGLKIGRPANEFFLPDAALAEARRFFASRNLRADRPTLFIQPFTSAVFKEWPLENYLAVARHWRAQGLQVIFGGGPQDAAALQPAADAGFPVAAGTPLLVSAGLMKLSTVALGGDTGLLHLTVAMGRRVVMLMGHNEPGYPHPYEHADWSLAPAPGKRVAEIALDRVMAAVVTALAETQSQPFSAPAGNVFC